MLIIKLTGLAVEYAFSKRPAFDRGREPSEREAL